MRAGRRNTKVIIESYSEAPDSVGDSIKTWSTFATVWVEFANQGGKEFINAREIHSSLSTIMTARYLDGVTPQMRVNHGGTYYNILAAFDPFNRRVDLKIYCDIQL